ncbi:unnamed protein product [Polarella glacialis]|uniref:Amine oxidase domain-containing protein n=1 Tax=Polarella glacialis TaxID=89957 RepID=A0A813G6T5_POLGL|nr:unnamed protein product [Polarella glacialis]
MGGGREMTWCIYTPITAASVKTLGLASGVYDPDPKNWDNQMRKLTDADGQNIGYLTLVETMLSRATQKGARIWFQTEVTALSAANSSSVQVQVADGRVFNAGAVLLNIPQMPVLKLLRQSGEPFSSMFPEPLYAPASFPIMKLYLHYEDAWWRNYLGLVSGPFENANASPNSSSAVINIHDIPSQGPAPLKGQYHDGDVRCDGPAGKCRGFLQAFYSGGSSIDWYKSFHSWNGDAAMHISSKSVEHKELLASIHSALVGLHREALDAANVTALVEKLRPDSGVLSIWSQGVTGIHAGCHVPKPGVHPKPEDLPAAALRPFPGFPVYVANEAYGTVPCFAEGSLNMSSAVLDHLNVPLAASCNILTAATWSQHETDGRTAASSSDVADVSPMRRKLREATGCSSSLQTTTSTTTSRLVQAAAWLLVDHVESDVMTCSCLSCTRIVFIYGSSSSFDLILGRKSRMNPMYI